MDRAIRYLLEKHLKEYVKNFDGINGASFPVTLSKLTLNEQSVQEDLEELGGEGCPFELLNGFVDSVTLQPSLSEGKLNVILSEVVLDFSFSTVKAMQRAMASATGMMSTSDDAGPPEPQPVQASPPPLLPAAAAAADVPLGKQPSFTPPPGQDQSQPRFCSRHDASEKRRKGEARLVRCEQCHLRLHTNYADFRLCPACSKRADRCMYCGESAPATGRPTDPGFLESRGNQGGGPTTAYPQSAPQVYGAAPAPPESFVDLPAPPPQLPRSAYEQPRTSPEEQVPAPPPPPRRINSFGPPRTRQQPEPQRGFQSDPPSAKPLRSPQAMAEEGDILSDILSMFDPQACTTVHKQAALPLNACSGGSSKTPGSSASRRAGG